MFCKKQRMYRCGVYAATQIKRKMVEEILANIISSHDLQKVVSNSHDTEIMFLNGSLIKVLLASDRARGHRFNGAIVDNDTDRERLNNVIYPYLIPLHGVEGIYNRRDNAFDRLFITNICWDDVEKSKKVKTKIERENLVWVSSRGYEERKKMICGIDFKKECEFMWTENEYDRPIDTRELNNDKVMLYEACGIPKENITYCTEFINKTKETYLNIKGYKEIKDLEFKNEVNIQILIDTDIYDGYEVHVDDGMIMVILHEIEKEQPVLKDCSRVV